MELVCGKRQHVYVLIFDIDVQMSRCLDCVRVEYDALVFKCRTDLSDGLDGSDLVIGIHDGHERRIITDSCQDLFRGHDAVAVNIEKSDLKSFLLKLFQCVQYCVMLKSRRDDVLLAFRRAESCRRDYRLVVGFASAGSERYLPGITSEARRDAGPGILQSFLCVLPERVQAGRVAVTPVHVGQHCLDGGFAHLGRSCIVCVYHVTSKYELYYYST